MAASSDMDSKIDHQLQSNMKIFRAGIDKVDLTTASKSSPFEQESRVHDPFTDKETIPKDRTEFSKSVQHVAGGTDTDNTKRTTEKTLTSNSGVYDSLEKQAALEKALRALQAFRPSKYIPRVRSKIRIQPGPKYLQQSFPPRASEAQIRQRRIKDAVRRLPQKFPTLVPDAYISSGLETKEPSKSSADSIPDPSVQHIAAKMPKSAFLFMSERAVDQVDKVPCLAPTKQSPTQNGFGSGESVLGDDILLRPVYDLKWEHSISSSDAYGDRQAIINDVYKKSGGRSKMQNLTSPPLDDSDPIMWPKETLLEGTAKLPATPIFPPPSSLPATGQAGHKIKVPWMGKHIIIRLPDENGADRGQDSAPVSKENVGGMPKGWDQVSNESSCQDDKRNRSQSCCSWPTAAEILLERQSQCFKVSIPPLEASHSLKETHSQRMIGLEGPLPLEPLEPASSLEILNQEVLTCFDMEFMPRPPPNLKTPIESSTPAANKISLRIVNSSRFVFGSEYEVPPKSFDFNKWSKLSSAARLPDNIVIFSSLSTDLEKKLDEKTVQEKMERPIFDHTQRDPQDGAKPPLLGDSQRKATENAPINDEELGRDSKTATTPIKTSQCCQDNVLVTPEPNPAKPASICVQVKKGKQNPQKSLESQPETLAPNLTTKQVVITSEFPADPASNQMSIGEPFGNAEVTTTMRYEICYTAKQTNALPTPPETPETLHINKQVDIYQTNDLQGRRSTLIPRKVVPTPRQEEPIPQAMDVYEACNRDVQVGEEFYPSGSQEQISWEESRHGGKSRRLKEKMKVLETKVVKKVAGGVKRVSESLDSRVKRLESDRVDQVSS